MTTSTSDPLRPLLAAQFFGAFNDNAWKIIVTLLALRGIADVGAAGEIEAQTRTTLAFVVFTLPLMIFSIPACFLADRIGKGRLLRRLKVVEIGLMAAGVGALLVAPTGGVAPLVVLGLMGVQSALFSPAKYGILPETLPEDRLSAANGALETWTFLAIILGTAGGGLLLSMSGPRPAFAAAALVIVAIAGWWRSRGLPDVSPAARPDRESDGALRGAWRALRSDRRLWLAVLGSTLFWSLVSLMGQDLLVYAKNDLGLSDGHASIPAAVFGLGVGAGAFLAGRISRGRIETGLIPLGALGLAVFTLIFGLLAPGFATTLVLMTFLGASAGLVIVPLDALLQHQAPATRRGAVIALSNVFVFGGMLAGSLGATALARVGALNAREIVIAASAITAAGTLWALVLLPRSFLRLAVILLTRTVYRLRVHGASRVPESGSALLVPNHVSFIDWALVLAATNRRVRFVVEEEYYRRPLIKPFMRLAGAIPVSTARGPRGLLRSLRAASEALDRGEIVCIFAEGEITRTGNLLPFRRGLERIVKGKAAPVIPVHLGRVHGSVFSPARRPGASRLQRPVSVSFGTPLPAGTPAADVRQAVEELSAETWIAQRDERGAIHRSLISAARRAPRTFALGDATRRLGRRRALAAAVVLARTLKDDLGDAPRVGVLLPASVGGALSNVAVSLAGRASVNLNFTTGPAALASACEQAGLRHVLTSRAFLERCPVTLPDSVTPIFLEDVFASAGRLRRLAAFALAVLAPVRWIERWSGARRAVRGDDVATILFSSGSTGSPKGVPLTHANLGANVEAVSQVVSVDGDDRLLGVLPLFHAFGVFSLWFSATTGMGIVFQPQPLDAAAVGDLVAREWVSVLLAPPTFLQLYLRRVEPARFGSLRLVIAGAEKLSPRLAAAFEDRFGIRPLEGYGSTECSPVVSLATPGYREAGFFQAGARSGTVGRPLPGVAARVVDRETGAPVPAGTAGLLLVRGPNVMDGYLARPEATREALRDGWYVTGDIAVRDEDGFITITDRAARFSKIGGEMVPHGRIEEALQEAAGRDDRCFAVTAVPDDRRGERLVVFHTLDDVDVDDLMARATAAGLPNLFLPRAEDVRKLDELPLLGTGKLDLRRLRELAEATPGIPAHG